MVRPSTRKSARGSIQQRRGGRSDGGGVAAGVNTQCVLQLPSNGKDADTVNAVLNFDVEEKGNNVSQYTQKDNSEYGTYKLVGRLGTGVTYEDAEKARKHANKTMMERLKESIRSKWYTNYKFITREDDARLMLTDALNRELISVPPETNMTEEGFIQHFQNKVYTTMSTLRHNSQNLARKNYLSE